MHYLRQKPDRAKASVSARKMYMTVQMAKVQPAGVISVLNSSETLPVECKNGSEGGK